MSDEAETAARPSFVGIPVSIRRDTWRLFVFVICSRPCRVPRKVTGGANGTTPSARGTALGSFRGTNLFRPGKETVGRPDAGLRVCRVRGSAAVGDELCGRRGEGGRIGQKMIKIEVREVHMERPSA